MDLPYSISSIVCIKRISIHDCKSLRLLSKVRLESKSQTDTFAVSIIKSLLLMITDDDNNKGDKKVLNRVHR